MALLRKEFTESIAYLTDDYMSKLPAYSPYDQILDRIERQWLESEFFSERYQKEIIEISNLELELEGVHINAIEACITPDMQIAVYIDIQTSFEPGPIEYFQDEGIWKNWEIVLENFSEHLLSKLTLEWKVLCKLVCFPDGFCELDI